MGEKRVKANWECKYCNYKGRLEELKELGYIDETIVGLVIYCPRCDTTQEVDR